MKPQKSSSVLTWNTRGQPVSKIFDDIYFSIDGGLDESRYVFLEQNKLAFRFKTLSPGRVFTVGETGFGTGLNFLACWQCWEQQAPKESCLTFISTEKYPLEPDSIKRSLSNWPELAPFRDAFLQHYAMSYSKDPQADLWFFSFARVRLVLMIGDAEQSLRKLLACEHPQFCQPLWQAVDAWFLDGFSPAKNPEMWRLSLLKTVAAISAPGTTLATFTAAGTVRRHLIESGFDVQKVKGFGNKREMLRASFDGTKKPGITFRKIKTPWSLPSNYYPGHRGQTVAVIGGGLAGCHAAYRLAKRGLQVLLFEAAPSLATEASGNPQGVVYAKLSPHSGNLADINLQGLLYAQQIYQDYWQANPDYGERCGVLQLDNTVDALEKHSALAERFAASQFLQRLSREQASDIAGVNLNRGGLFFPYCGWLNLPKLCQWLTDQPNISLFFGVKVEQLTRRNDHWQLRARVDADGKWLQRADHVVIASANYSRYFDLSWLPVKAIRGQLSYLPQSSDFSLSTVLCAKGYMTPVASIFNGCKAYSVGASFNLGDNSSNLLQRDHDNNIAQMEPYLEDCTLPSAIGGRVSFRCASPDYLPLAGFVPDAPAFREIYRALRVDAQQAIPEKGCYLPQLYLSIGHGSRGLIYAPLAAEVITSRILGEPPPLSQQLLDALSPARFLIRELIRVKSND